MRARLLTPDLSARLCEHLSGGLSLTRAAGLAGVSYLSVQRWLTEGQRHMRREADGFALSADDRALADFARDVQRAQSTWAAKLLNVVSTDALADGVSSAQWLLERQFPDDFGRRVQVEQVVLRELEKILDVARDALSPESYGALLAALARAGFGDAPPVAGYAAAEGAEEDPIG